MILISSFCLELLVTKGLLSIKIISPDVLFISGLDAPLIKLESRLITLLFTVNDDALNVVSIVAVNPFAPEIIFVLENSKFFEKVEIPT